MPPRKKAKPAPSSPITDENSMAIDTPAPRPTKAKAAVPPPYDILKDPWTDEQESSLFKGLMKWKPNGQYSSKRLFATLLTIPRNAQTLPHDRIIRASTKPRLRSTSRATHTNPRNMAKATNTLQHAHNRRPRELLRIRRRDRRQIPRIRAPSRRVRGNHIHARETR